MLKVRIRIERFYLLIINREEISESLLKCLFLNVDGFSLKYSVYASCRVMPEVQTLTTFSKNSIYHVFHHLPNAISMTFCQAFVKPFISNHLLKAQALIECEVFATESNVDCTFHH